MQSKQTSYSFKEIFCSYSKNHVRLASIMWYCALIIVVLTASRNFGVEAAYENATHTTEVPEKTRGTSLPIFTSRNVTRLLSEADLRNINIQAVYNIVADKILLNVTWNKPSELNDTYFYNFKISPNSSLAYCMQKSFESRIRDTALTSILLPRLLDRYEILPGCKYKITVATNRSDSNKNVTAKDIIYSVPGCVGKKCSCRTFAPVIKKFEADEFAPGKLNISWQFDDKKLYNNITNVIFEYSLNNSKKLANDTFKKIVLPLEFTPNTGHYVLDNTNFFEVNRPYQLRAVFGNTYNCKTYSNTNVTVTATKSPKDIKQTKSTKKEEIQSYNDNNSSLSTYDFTTSQNNASNLASDGKIYNIKVQAIYNTTHNKIVLNVTWNRPLGWNDIIDSYRFKLSPNSSHCMHETSFEIMNTDKSFADILLPPLTNKYEIIPGCTYIVSIITKRSNLGVSISDIVYTVPDCVGKKCSCSKLTPRLKGLEAAEFSPGKLSISWKIDDAVSNITTTNITEKTFAYRPSASVPAHNNPFKNLAFSPNIEHKIDRYETLNISSLEPNTPYQLRASFKNTYNCRAYLYTNFTVTAPIVKNETKEDDNSWMQLTLFLIFLSFLILAVLYLLRRNRLIIKEILRNPLSFRFSRRRSRRAEARTSYIMIPTIAKRQQEINLLYVDKEIIDGEADRYEFPRSRITLIREIGNGAFGQVYLAKALGIAQQPGDTYVAVKKLREKAPPEEVDDFLSEIEILKKVGEHPNIVRILGCCVLKEPYLMVMEFVPCGDLKNYLLELRHKWRRKRTRNDSSPVFSDSSDGAYVLPDSPISRIASEGRPSVTETEYTSLESEGFPTPTELFNSKVERTLDHTELQNFALQIAKGMEHLEKIPIAHRDLAARNILINEYKTLKISDFGLSRVGPYVNSKTKKLPLRWVSLEAIEDHFYDSKGDVWSYAVVLWEIGTLGAFPYEDIIDGMLVHYLQSGKRLPRPEICTDELYSLMLKCWSRDPQLRPSFQELVELLDVKKTRVYVDFNQLNPLYVFPPSKIPEFDKNSNLPQNDSTA